MEGTISQSYDGLEDKILEDSRIVLYEEYPIFEGIADTYPCKITSPPINNQHAKSLHHQLTTNIMIRDTFSGKIQNTLKFSITQSQKYLILEQIV